MQEIQGEEMNCDKCEKKLGFFESIRNDSFAGVFCDECLEEMKNET